MKSVLTGEDNMEILVFYLGVYNLYDKFLLNWLYNCDKDVQICTFLNCCEFKSLEMASLSTSCIINKLQSSLDLDT